GSQALDRELKTLGDAIAAGYGRGEKAEMFLNVDVGVRNEFQVGGLQLVAYRIEHRLMFLPGGVFIDSHDGVKEFRTPDLAWLKEEKLLGSWKRSGENYIVTRADGSVTTYRPGKKDGQQRSLTADGKQTHWEVAHLTAADLIGSYASIDTTTSG